MKQSWWILVLLLLLLISGIHPNPGPRKARKQVTTRKEKKQRQDLYKKKKDTSTKAELEEQKEHKSAYMHTWRSNPENKETEAERNVTFKKRLRSSSEYREEERERNVGYKRRLRSNSPVREIERTRTSSCMQKLRSNSPYKEDEKERNILCKKKQRSRSPFRETDRKLTTSSMKKLRANSLYKEDEKERNILCKKKQRSHSPFREADRKLTTSCMKKLRSRSPFKEDEKERDILRKRKQRSCSPFREADRKLTTSCMKKLRSRSPYKEDEKDKDILRKKKQRSHSPFREADRKRTTLCMKKLRSNSPYREDERDRDALSKKTRRLNCKEQLKNIAYVSAKFKENIQNGPVCVCTCCKRMMYRHSVVHVPSDKYSKVKDRKLVEKCLTGYKSFQGFQWICKTCHQAIKAEKMPSQAEANLMSIEEQPFELADLSPLEERLISLRLPFMQLVNLPRGSQKGIKGPVVNVPSSLDSVISLMPRLPSQCGLVPLKLKRKLVYKGHVLYQSVRPANVMSALRFLKHNHKQYGSVDINDNWIDDSYRDDKKLACTLLEEDDAMYINSDIDDEDEASSQQDQPRKTGMSGDVLESSDESKEPDKELSGSGDENEDKEQEDANKLRGLPFNSCLQPEAAAYSGKEIYSVAPGEGNHPISLFTDPDCETLAFPALFPTGQFGYSMKDRPVNISCRRYFNQRLLNMDNRFSQNIEYLFFAQYFCEAKQILDNVSIALRKGSSGGKLTAGFLSSTDNVNDVLKQNEGFRFLQNIRGSYPYWLKTLFDLNAMVRQLGIPTWFCSFSAADLRWPETIRIIAQQLGQSFTDEEIINMDWQQRCMWLRSNPVTADRQFDYRVSRFINDVLHSEAAPLGIILDHFIRTEFQQRGSPHIHCLFWVEGAPKIGQDSEEDVCNFIDAYVSAAIPDMKDNEELHDLVTSLQRHTHSATCKTSNKPCRFNFPRPPTDTTIIAGPPDIENIDPSKLKQRKEENMLVLKKVQDAVVKDPSHSLSSILTEEHITEEMYMNALKESTSNPTIILKRQPADTCINNYNPNLLKIWNANLDVQFVTNAYACAMYILSYVSKGERQMGELLKAASKECGKDDTIRKKMKKLGNVFLTHRELGAPEAGYRLLSIPLMRCTRAIVFINTGMPHERTRILKSQRKLLALPSDSEDIFENGIIEKYIARPDILRDLCLAEFATSYRMKGASKDVTDVNDDEKSDDETEQSANTIEKGKEITLKNDLGIMVKRRKRAICRSPRFSPVKSPEKYYHSILMLYHPWRNEISDLLGDNTTYEESFALVEDMVKQNITQFEHNSEELDFALQNAHNQPENIWDEHAAGVQKQERDDECEKPSIRQDDSEADQYLNDFVALPEMSTGGKGDYTVEVKNKELSIEDYHSTVRSLNDGQRQLFNHIFGWCRQVAESRKTSKQVQPFHIFLTGGAGTGKSHLIKAIVSMARRELRCVRDSPDKETVLLIAPTGIAAANIDGTTIHHAFSISVQKDFFGQEKLATLRFALENLRLVVIDEISMVGLQLFTQVHKRLQDVRGVTDPEVLFGGVSILAVGDLYKLEPVLQKPIFQLPSDPYHRLNPTHLWRDLFKVVELNEIMRQQDDLDFASLLNRVRVGCVTATDISVLQSRLTNKESEEYPHNALHVFAENKDVDDHNLKMLSTLPTERVILNAVDRKKDLNTDLATVINIPDDPSKTGGLAKTLKLAVGARVMVTRNIDVQDGLVNGVQGEVVGFLRTNNNVTAVSIKFDNDTVGQQLKMKHNIAKSGAVPIFQQESRFSLNKKGSIDVTRKQFPLKLAFASTIHKVQGLSLDQIVVSFDGAFRAGQAYVALSRARSLKGLFLLNFSPTKIRVSKTIELKMERLRKEMPLVYPAQPLLKLSSDVWLKICSLNAQSLRSHFSDLSTYQNILSADVICVCETWLDGEIDTINIPGFKFHHRSRKECYQNHDCADRDRCSKCNNKGGVGVFAKEDLPFEMIGDVSSCNESLAFSIQKNGQTYHIVFVYRPDHVKQSDILRNIQLILTRQRLENMTIVLGDFNIDYNALPADSPFMKVLSEKKMLQIITDPSHISGSLLDHIYINRPSTLVISGVIPCYFSDHNAVFAILPAPGDEKELKPLTVCSESSTTGKTQSKLQLPNCMKEKRSNRLTRQSLSSSRSQVTDKNNNNLPDIQIVNVEDNQNYVNHFMLPTPQDQKTVADILHLNPVHDPHIQAQLYNIRYRGYLRTLQLHTVPCIIDAIEPDGNCFYRAISKQLLGTQKYHHRIRQLICNFEEKHINTFQNYYYGDETFRKHISTQRHLRQWATEVELVATATYFNTTIWEFTEQFPVGSGWKWIEIAKEQLHQDDPPYDGIPIEGHFYVHHTWGIHFDCVFPVEGPPSHHASSQ